MSSPFDFVNSFIRTKESLYTSEELFQKEYAPFIINRALSNDSRTLLFADAINTYPNLDVKLQHDFYFYGLPKLKVGKLWTKKEEDMDTETVKFISKKLNVSMKRAIELLPFFDEEEIAREKNAEGGRGK